MHKNNRDFVVLGGAGTIGRVVVRDLFESHPKNTILVADANLPAAVAIADSFRSPRVRAVETDARDLRNLMRTMRDCHVAINCLQHDLNLQVMNAALFAGVHYLDLGGLYHWTVKQLQFHELFREKNLTAVLGMGCAPGITNVMAAYAVKRLGRVRAVKIRVGAATLPGNAEFSFPHSAQTVIEELTLNPFVLRDGIVSEVMPRTGWELTRFPKPVSGQWTVLMRHSELATLPMTLLAAGLQSCDFKAGFSRKFVNELMRRMQKGWTLKQFNALVKPIDHKDDYEITRVIADDLMIDCHVRAKPAWQASADAFDTACPISIVAQMVADGSIDRRGVLPPEIAVPCYPFFEELKKRGMEIRTSLAPA